MIKTRNVLIILIILSLIPISSAIQPEQKFVQIYLNPFYRASLTSNTNYTYNVSINPPDGYGSTVSAIINFEVYLTPTVNFNLWVNGKTCNNANYTVSTTYAGSGQGKISYDCSNIIKTTGTYNITLRPISANTGSINGWLELTYMNQPKGTATVHGTEYIAGNPAKLWLQLLNTTLQPITQAICYIDIYTPNNQIYIERAEMTNMNHDGIYYYDLIAPTSQGVYPAIATCYYTATATNHNITAYSIESGSYNAGTIQDTNIEDGNFLRIKETSTINPRNISIILNATNLTSCLNISELLFTGINVETYMKFDSVTNDVTISIYNYTSNSWIQLPNKHLESNAFTKTSNTINFNNLTKSGLYNNTKDTILIKLEDTQLADGTQSNLDIDLANIKCEQLGSSGWEEIKGSSEIHINTGLEGLLFGVNTLCNNDNLLGDCAQFFQNTTILPEQQGLITDNITIYNTANLGSSLSLNYETGTAIDCLAIISIKDNHNGTITDITNISKYGIGNGLDNCKIQIPVELKSNESQYQITIIMENFAKWEILRSNDLISIINNTITDFCYDFNYTYEIPIINPLNLSNGYRAYCNRILDDLYWYDTLVREESSTVNTIGELGSYLIESRFYYP
jgi:hypothetical protein